MGKRKRHVKGPTKTLHEKEIDALPKGTVKELEKSVDNIHAARRELKTLRKRKKITKRPQNMDGKLAGGWRAARDAHRAKESDEDEDESASEEEDDGEAAEAAGRKAVGKEPEWDATKPSAKPPAKKAIAKKPTMTAKEAKDAKKGKKVELGPAKAQKKKPEPEEDHEPDWAKAKKMLRYAAAGDISGMSKLKASGAAVGGFDRKTGVSAVMMASGKGQLKALRWLLNNRAPVDARDKKGDTALTFAAQTGSMETLEWLIPRWGKKWKADCERACIVAAQAQQIPIVKRLLQEEGVKARVSVTLKATLTAQELREMHIA